MKLCSESSFLHIRLAAGAVLFGAVVIAIVCAEAIDTILRRDHAATFATAEKLQEREISRHVRSPRLASPRKHLLHCFKQGRGKNWLKASVVPFVVMFDEAEICKICQYADDGSFPKWRTLFGGNAVFRQILRETFQRIRSFGVFFVCTDNDARTCRMRLNRPCLEIIDVAKGRARQPFTSAEFLADTAIDILHQIVRIVFRLSER